MKSLRLRYPSISGRGLFIAALAFAIATHLLLIGAFIWSRDGERTVIELQNVDGAQRLTSDGRQVIPRADSGLTHDSIDAPLSGTVVLVLLAEVPSMPSPSGIDSIVIRGATGSVLFEDDFETLRADVWEVVQGRFEIADGVLTTTQLGRNELRLRGPGFSNYDVVVTYRNSRGGLVGTHVSEGNGLYWHIELIRDFPNFVDVFKDGPRTGLGFGTLMRNTPSGPVASIAHMVTRPYPFMLVALPLGVLLTLLLGQVRFRFVPRPERTRFLTKLPMVSLAAGVLVVGAFVVALTINERYYSRLPHAPDEVAYIFQANLLADFEVTREIPPVSRAFHFYSPPFLVEHADRWASFYPFGHPVALAFGALFGAVWAIPPLLGAATVCLTYLTGRRLYDGGAGLIAAGLLASSPFFLMQSSNFMSHSSAAFFVIASLFFLIKRDRPLLFGALAGLMFGLGVNTRPLTMLALVLPFGAIMLTYLLTREEGPRVWLKHTGGFLFGVSLMILAMLAYNYGITGDPLTTTYSQSGGGAEELFGFRDGHSLDIGLRNEQAQTMALLQVFNAWPSFAGLALVMVPFLVVSRHRWDYLLLACTLLPMAIFIGYRFSGLFGGPRYWYEVTPFLVLLSARGITLSAELLYRAGGEVARRMPRLRSPSPWAGNVVVYAAVGLLLIYGSGGWVTGLAKNQNSPLVPFQASALEGMFGVDDRLNRLAEESDLSNALVLVEPCGFYGSYVCYGSVFLRNLPDFNGDVVWALDLPETNAALIAAYPGRDVYVASFDDGGSLRVYTGE
ncbi:MAG TPA: glycosyltransferase family 39 protein [Dehalococcoidia bacterium]|nr:glycosyltransferase family 39 protein [Dehalococcoidia bacterium]